MHETEDEYADLIGDLYVETATCFIYEVKFFTDFVIARPASPAFYLAIRKMSYNEFANEFHEYGGDHEAARAAFQGLIPDLVVN